MWNHRLHERWAAEDLTFWRFAFFPRYRQKAVVEIIHRVMGERGVLSYAIYETLGLFDLFVRAWLPSQTLERFERDLEVELQRESLQLLESFVVSRILRHHDWDDVEGHPLEPTDDVLAARDHWSQADIRRINEGELGPGEQEALLKDRLLTPLKRESGIKFFTVITPAVYSQPGAVRGQLSQRLLGILTEGQIGEPSLYEGRGFGQFILMGRVPAARFFDIPKIALAINDLGFQEIASARPYTHVCSRDQVIWYADKLPTDDVEEPVNVLELLSDAESRRFEAKGSARLNLKRWLSTDEAQPVPDESVLNEGVIKAIVGMLNADGGHVILGALEVDDQFGRFRADEHPKLKGRYPVHGRYICLGVNDEYAEKGWDGFRLWLQDVISSRIDPPPAGTLSINRHDIDGRDLCVIGIQPTQATWFYRLIGPDQPASFFVREEGRTVAYAGNQADIYKRSQPRG